MAYKFGRTYGSASRSQVADTMQVGARARRGVIVIPPDWHHLGAVGRFLKRKSACTTEQRVVDSNRVMLGPGDVESGNAAHRCLA